MIKKIETDHAPKAVGPYSQAVVAHNLVFVSGQIALDPETNIVESSDIVGQTQMVLRNLNAVLKASGASATSVLKTTVYLKNMTDFAAFNAEYEQFFAEHKPARACVEVARLPKDVLVEIDAIAQCDHQK